MRSRADTTLALLLTPLLWGCGGVASEYPRVAAAIPAPRAVAPPSAGPAVAEGPSGTSNAVTDRYDAVGYSGWYGEEMGGSSTASGAPFDPAAITAAHRTLPLGSVAEVTALDTGRTILVLVNDRGPGRRDREIDLSRGAAQALGIAATPVTPVRVRAVTAAPADMRALRSGQPASARLDAPPALLKALRNGLPVPVVTQASVAIQRTESKRPNVDAPRPARPVPGGKFAVQVAAFSSEARARGLARALGGSVQPVGALWRVRLGPFVDMKTAQRARDGAARRGYGGARVQPAF